jgi:hypothetical protein
MVDGDGGGLVHGVLSAKAAERSASETIRLDAIAKALGGGQAASWPVAQAQAELGLLADLFTRDQDVSAAKTRAPLGWAPARTSIVTYLTA